MGEERYAIVIVSRAIMEAMTKSVADGISCAEVLYLNPWLATAFREQLATTTKIPDSALSHKPYIPKTELEPWQLLITNFDGVNIVEDSRAYQPLVVGPLVSSREREIKKAAAQTS